MDAYRQLIVSCRLIMTIIYIYIYRYRYRYTSGKFIDIYIIQVYL